MIKYDIPDWSRYSRRFYHLQSTKYSSKYVQLDSLLSNSFSLLYTLCKVVQHLQSKSYTTSQVRLIRNNCDAENFETVQQWKHHKLNRKYKKVPKCTLPMFKGDMGENHTKQSHWGVDYRYAQWEGPWDGLANRDTQVDGRGVMLKCSAARCTVRL